MLIVHSLVGLRYPSYAVPNWADTEPISGDRASVPGFSPEYTERVGRGDLRGSLTNISKSGRGK